ncbi:MAG: tRNA lysidine(34) synthetase TilS [Planctomycetota bacterium]|nr:MAG: tRNA lysidine(34) synthetase TilS [Planctomycetota bacterium]
MTPSNRSTLLEQLCIQALRLFPPQGQPVVVAVSGGADSCALLDGLVRLRRWPLIVCHIDHCLREESGDEAEFLRRRIAWYRDNCQADLIESFHRADVASLASVQRIGLEEAGRDLRYRTLGQVAVDHRAEVVATAHHRGDQAETVIAHMLRGAGPIGLGGMPEERQLIQGIRIVRPLLSCNHDDCCQHLTSQGLDWVEDSSNLDVRFWRNRLRHDVLPALEEGVPGFTQALLDYAQDQREQAAEAVLEVARLLTSEAEGLSSLRLPAILAAPLSVRSLLWRQLCLNLRLPIDRRIIAALEDLAHGEQGRRFDLGNTLFLKHAQRLSWEIKVPLPSDPNESHPIQLPGETSLGDGATIQCRLLEDPVDVIAAPHEAFIDESSIRGPLVWRFPLDGERWRSFGSEGSKTVLRYLADRGIPSRARRRMVVVADDEGVVWIPGCTIADRVQVNGRSQRAWYLRHRQPEGEPQLT